jgi:hypothetical protein
MIAVNGQIVAQGSQFSLSDVEVVSATVDIEDVRAHRTHSSRSMQAAGAERYPRIEVPMPLSGSNDFALLNTTAAREFTVRYHTPEEEIAFVNVSVWFTATKLDCLQLGTSVLALGLLTEVTNPRLLCSPQWGN